MTPKRPRSARRTGEPCAMSSDDADRYRKQAEECRQQAQKALRVLDKEMWLNLLRNGSS
jgi:hypothetical protein